MAKELALPLEGGAINARTISEAFSLPLQRLVASANDANDFVRRAREIPKLMEEVRSVAPLVARMALPLSEADVAEILGPLVLLYGTPDFGSDRALAASMTHAWRATYAKALRNVPREALEHAVSEWIRVGDPINPRRSASFPKPVDLISLSKEKSEEIHMISYRIRKALESVGETKPAPTQAEKDEVRSFLANLKMGKSLGEAVAATRPMESQGQMASRLRSAAGA